ncbi:MAG: L-cystine import ATP-binding protein TcyN [Fimbriimonadaceae bacterium]|nr:L-cystine import ATP-binding protein TcyN [Fimbriimonadaceae bacterium]
MVVTIRDIHHAFDSREVLKGISLDVSAGEILAIMGSSGGGKTTLLKIIAGLLRPTSGDVKIGDTSVVQDPELAHQLMGMVFQYAALFDYMSVAENILFGIKRKQHLDRKQQEQLVKRKLEVVGLPDAGPLMPSQLSGGMRKRVGLARALAMEPKILLFDEPTSGLDPITAYSIDRLIVDTRNQTGSTSLVVSHDVNSVLRVADRIAFLHHGELAFVGTPKAFKDEKNAAIRELVDKAEAKAFGEVASAIYDPSS